MGWWPRRGESANRVGEKERFSFKISGIKETGRNHVSPIENDMAVFPRQFLREEGACARKRERGRTKKKIDGMD